MADLVFFPEAFIQLNREICEHPELCERLMAQGDIDQELQFAKMIAVTAAYVNVALDDTYTQDDLIKIADICIDRLKRRRMAILVNQSTPINSTIVDEKGNPLKIH